MILQFKMSAPAEFLNIQIDGVWHQFGPGQSRDDWEIIRDLTRFLSGSEGLYEIEDVFKQIAVAVPEMNELSLSKISDKGVQFAERTQPLAAMATGFSRIS
jgi:hypothetical protein